MISPETLRRYPFFAGFGHDQLVTLAMMASEQHVEAGHFFFHESDALSAFYLVVEGQVAVLFEVPSAAASKSVAGQLTGEMVTRDVTISDVGPGEPFGWTSISAVGQATAGAKAVLPTVVLAFDRDRILAACEQDPVFGYRMLTQILGVARQRLHDLRVESLEHVAGAREPS